MKQHAANTVDFTADNSDPIPGVVHALSEIYLGLKSFPRFVRSTRGDLPSAPNALTQEPS